MNATSSVMMYNYEMGSRHHEVSSASGCPSHYKGSINDDRGRLIADIGKIHEKAAFPHSDFSFATSLSRKYWFLPLPVQVSLVETGGLSFEILTDPQIIITSATMGKEKACQRKKRM